MLHSPPFLTTNVGLKEMNQDTLDRHLDKLAGAHVAMLCAVGALLGIIVSATSIIASVGGSKSPLLFPAIVVSFIGVACVLATFYQEKKEFLRAFEVMAEMENMSRSEQVKMVLSEIGRKSAANRLSNATLVVTLIASVLFLVLCAQTFSPDIVCLLGHTNGVCGKSADLAIGS
jgi:hypothetical protein